jgi:hypothetical protein
MCVVEVRGGAGAARLQGGPSPTRGAVALSDREVDAICWLVGHVTEVRKGIEGVSYYAARDYDEEIEGRRIALESASELGKFGISSYLERRGLKPDKVEAKEKRYGFEHAFHGKIRFYIWIGDTVHVFEETDERRGRYVGEYATKELEEYGI